MNASKLVYLLKCDHWVWQTFSCSPRQWITERNTTSAHLIARLKKLTFVFSSTHFVLMRFVSKQYNYRKSGGRDK